MKYLYFKDHKERLEYLKNYLTFTTEASLFCGYEDALFFKDVFPDAKIFTDYYGIDIQSDAGKYIVSIVHNEFFCIEPVIKNGKMLKGEPLIMLVMDYIKSVELLENFKSQDITIVEIRD